MISVFHGAQFDERIKTLQGDLLNHFHTHQQFNQLIIVPTNRWEKRFKEDLIERSSTPVLPEIPVFSFRRFLRFIYEKHQVRIGDLTTKQPINRALKIKFLEDILINHTAYLNYYRFDDIYRPKQGTLSAILASIEQLIAAGYNADSFKKSFEKGRNLSIRQADLATVFSFYETEIIAHFYDEHIIQMDLDKHFMPDLMQELFPHIVQIQYIGFDKFSHLMNKTIKKLLSFTEQIYIQINGNIDDEKLMIHTSESLKPLLDGNQNTIRCFDNFDDLTDKLHYKCFDTFDQEITAILHRIKQQIDVGYDYSDIIIAYPYPDKFAQNIRVKFQEIELPLNLSSGIPVLSANSIKFMMLIFKLVNENFNYKDIISFFSSAYIKTEKEFPEQAFVYLCQHKRLFNSLNDMILAANDNSEKKEFKLLIRMLTQLQKRFKSLRFERDKPEQIFEKIKTILNHYKFNESIVDSGMHVDLIEWDVKAYYRFSELISELNRSLSRLKKNFKISLKDYSDLLLQNLRDETYQIRDKQNFGVRVLPLLECRSEQARILFMAGMNQSVIPKIKKESQFFDEDEINELQIESAESRTSEDRYLIDVVSKTVKDELCISSHLAFKGESDYPSVLVDEFKQNKEIIDWTESYQQSDFEPKLIRQNLTDILPEELDLKKDQPQIWQNKQYSATELDNYQSCPYQYYARRVLKLRSVDDVSEELPNYSKGNFVHQVLYRFHSEQGHLLPSLTEKMKRIKEISDDVLSSVDFKSISIFWHTELDNYLKENGIFEKYLEIDEQELAEFKPSYFEWEFGASESNDLQELRWDLEEDQIKVHGKIDRIDVDENGNFIVIDYKTSKSLFSSKDILTFRSFQLPLYVLAVAEMIEAEPAGAVYFQIASNRQVEKRMRIADKSFFNTNSRSTAFLPNYLAVDENNNKLTFDAFLKKVKTEIIDVHHRILDKHFAPNPRSPEECRYCDYKTMCRLEEIKI